MFNLVIGFGITLIFAVIGMKLSTLIHEENLRKEIVDYDNKV